MSGGGETRGKRNYKLCVTLLLCGCIFTFSKRGDDPHTAAPLLARALTFLQENIKNHVRPRKRLVCVVVKKCVSVV